MHFQAGNLSTTSFDCLYNVKISVIMYFKLVFIFLLTTGEIRLQFAAETVIGQGNFQNRTIKSINLSKYNEERLKNSFIGN